MSSLWTPEGERPVGRPSGSSSAGQPADAVGHGQDDPMTEEEVAEQMAALREQLAQAPASAVIANHCFGFFELAALHLSLQPPQLGEAQVAIDALAAVVDGLGERLGEQLPTLREGLAQLRLAFVQIRAANLGQAPPPEG